MMLLSMLSISLFLLAGITTAQRLNATWVIQIANGQGSSPAPREYHTLTYVHNATNGNNSNAVLFGGLGTANDRTVLYLNDTWVLRFPRSGWLKLDLQKVPPARYHHSAVEYGREVIIFGGRNESIDLNDVWRFDTDSTAWTEDEYGGASIAGRNFHSAARVGEVLYVFGGSVEKIGETNELLAYNLTTKTWRAVRDHSSAGSPPARRGATLTPFHSELGPSLILYGGSGTDGQSYNDVWQYLIGQDKWVLLSAVESGGPARRFGHTAISNATSNSSTEIVIFGGANLSPNGQVIFYNDVWSLKLAGSTSTWSLVIPEEAFGPGRRAGHVSFRARGESFVFGGFVQNVGLHNDLWMLDYNF